MPTYAPPARTEISDTYPNPSNAVARIGFGSLWDYVVSLLGATGTPADARTALGLVIGTNVQAYNAANAFTNVAQSFTAAQRGTVTALTSAATITPNFATTNNFSLTLAINTTLANPTNLTAGQSGAIVITQDATGSRTMAFGSFWDFAGGTAPSLTTTANAVDVLVYYANSASKITASVIGDVK